MVTRTLREGGLREMPDENLDAPWTIEQGLLFVRCLQSRIAPLGYGVALAGSVLMKGDSKTDLDVVVFPYNTDCQSHRHLSAALKDHGLTRRFSQQSVQRYRRQHGQQDPKHLEIWMHGKQRVDLFFLK